MCIDLPRTGFSVRVRTTTTIPLTLVGHLSLFSSNAQPELDDLIAQGLSYIGWAEIYMYSLTSTVGDNQKRQI